VTWGFRAFWLLINIFHIINHFWGRRRDGVAINEDLQIAYILEFEWSTDRDEGFIEVKEAEANEQHKRIISALRKLEFEQIHFVVGKRGSVVESDFSGYTKLKRLDVQEGDKDKLFADYVTQVCEEHNRVIVFLLQQVKGGARPTTLTYSYFILSRVYKLSPCFTSFFSTMNILFFLNTARNVVTVVPFFKKILITAPTWHIYKRTYRGTHVQANMHDQHIRRIASTRHRSLVGRGGRKACDRNKGLVHTILTK